MVILLFFAFLSGLVTIAAPCIWPLLPIILSTTSSGGKHRPLGITVGIVTSFAFFTLTLSYVVRIIPFDPEILRWFAVFIIGFLGITLLIPHLSVLFEGWVSRLSGSVGLSANTKNQQGFRGGFLIGIPLGLIWTPCAGPILATIATLAATRSVNLEIVLVTIFYSAGVGLPLFLFAMAGRSLFTQSRVLNKYTGYIQQIFGGLMILTAVAISTGYESTLQKQLLDTFPFYAEFVTTLESNENVEKELERIRGPKPTSPALMRFPQSVE